MTAIASQQYGHTGRTVLGAGAEQRAIDWSTLKSRDALLSHDVAIDFEDLVRNAFCLTGDSVTLFRGQGITEAESEPPSIERMGPLPLHLVPAEGRYNRTGERALYLADSLNGVRREWEAWGQKGTPYAIRASVPLSAFRVADFSAASWGQDHLITAVFSRAETCNVNQRGPSDYTFSQSVAELVSRHFDGMLIPGVRGKTTYITTTLLCSETLNRGRVGQVLRARPFDCSLSQTACHLMSTLPWPLTVFGQEARGYTDSTKHTGLKRSTS